jgi:ABC-type transporter Mla subunit MlaD
MTDPVRLADMRTAAEEMEGLSPYARKTLEGAVSAVEAHWSAHLKDASENAGKAIDDAHNSVMSESERLKTEAAQIADQVEAGRMTAKEARAWLRDSINSHTQLLGEHEQLLQRDAELQALTAMSPDEYQEYLFERHPGLQQNAKSLSRAVQEYAEAHPPRSKAPRRRVDPHALSADEFEAARRNPNAKPPRRGSSFEM